MDDKESGQQNRPQHPKETANLLSLITFFYSWDLFKKGYKKDLEDEDLYQVLSSCQSRKLGDVIENQWEIEKKKHKSPSLFRVLWKCFGKTYMIFGIVQFIVRTILVVAIPEALGKLVSYFNPGQNEITKEDAYCYAATIIFLSIANFIYTQNYQIALTELGIRIRTSICSFIYRKTLKLNERTINEISMGKVVTLITKDIHAIEMIILFGNDMWIGLIQTAIICYLIYGKIGVATFAGVGFFLIVLPLQIIIGRMSTLFRLKTSKMTDERLSLTQEMLSVMKIIKMYSWETFFNDQISKSRKKEVNSIFKLFLLKIIIIVIGSLSAKIAFYLLIMTYVWMGYFINAEIVYFIKSCFHKLRHFLSIMLPLGISFGAEFSATSVRLESILHAEEVAKSRKSSEIRKQKLSINFNNVSVKIRDTVIIGNVCIEIKKGLNIVVGHIGSGKTSLLKTILEDYKIDGTLNVCGNISYASQEPWLFPASIRNNILFGAKMNWERYSKVLTICALNHDLKCCIEEYDNALVGDNGMNLSKGQQARINLARAIYKEADIYLLDDCLAPLDEHVSDFIFKECIMEFLKDKLCIFVSNNSNYTQSADWIIEICNGTITVNENIKKDIFELTKVSEIIKSNNFIKLPEKYEAKDIYKESKKSGKVEFVVYKKYFKFGGGYVIFSIILLMFVIVQGVVSYGDKLVSNWVTLEQNLSNYQLKNITNTSDFYKIQTKRTYTLNLYTIIIISSTGLALIKSLCFFSFNRKASINLHKAMISNIVKAKMAFFDLNFIGNVLNRFSKDLCTIDEHLPFVMNECLELLFVLGGILFLVASVNSYFLIPATIFSIIAYLMRFIYLKTGRSLQRLEASTRSPLIGHLNATLEGITTIRAFKAQEMFKAEFDKHQDLYTSTNYTLHNSMRALAFILDGMCSLFIIIVIIWFLIIPNDTTVGNVGLAITQAFHLTGLLQYGIRRWADFENQMTSVERVLQYTQIEQENFQGKNIVNWPENGHITFDKVYLEYGGKQVLKNINFEIKSKQKIGIVGRTGAGKSSIISALFRLYNIKGRIMIDNVNCQEVTLNLLRSCIAVIPQDPFLISGTIRQNVDPLNKFSDEEIWKVIKIVDLGDIVNNLNDRMNNSSTFSAGQKQLICLARAILNKNKIMVLDEVTANLDNNTDTIIQNVIEQEFASCTVIIIAHRLSSVLKSDIVMVVHDGTIVEQDTITNLLQNKNSIFFGMIK